MLIMYNKQIIRFHSIHVLHTGTKDAHNSPNNSLAHIKIILFHSVTWPEVNSAIQCMQTSSELLCWQDEELHFIPFILIIQLTLPLVLSYLIPNNYKSSDLWVCACVYPFNFCINITDLSKCIIYMTSCIHPFFPQCSDD